MDDHQICSRMGISLAELQESKESIVRKLAPELLDEHGLTVDEAMQVIVANMRVVTDDDFPAFREQP